MHIDRAIVVLSSSLLTVAVHADGWDLERRLTRNEASSQTSINFARSIAADREGRVHTAWVDARDGNAEIYYKRSPDGGVSWGPPVRLTFDASASVNPAIAASGNHVHVAWWDERTGVPQVWAKRSTDGGLTWSRDALIVESTGSAAHPSIAVRGAAVHVTWVDGRDGSSEVYHRASFDAGATWGPEQRLSSLPFNSYTPTIAVMGAWVYVAWTDTRHGGQPNALEEEYLRRSPDGGQTWLPEQRLTEDPEGAPANSWAPSLAAYGARVWITWFDERDGNWEIYVKQSPDHGATWSPDVRLTDAEGASVRPSIARFGSDLWIAWWDTRDGEEEIYAIRSPDLGATWGPEQRLTFAPGASVRPCIAAARSGLHLAWQDTRNGNEELWYRRVPGLASIVGNGRIAFTRTVSGAPQIFSAAPDGSDIRQLTFAGANSYPAWSKDGTRLAFSSDRTGSDALWTMRPGGAQQAPLTVSTPGADFVPDWAWDGTRLAYASVEPGVGHPEVWTVTADGQSAARLTRLPDASSGAVHPSYAPNDQAIWFAGDAGGGPQLFGMFPDGQGLEQKTNGLGATFPHANVPEFSRSGDLVFWSGFEGLFGEVWTWPVASGGGPAPLTSTPNPANSDNPSWAPNGARVLFDTNIIGDVSVWSIDPDGGDAMPLLLDAFGQTSWQPVFALLAADLDEDGDVDGADLALLLGAWGPCGGCHADIDGNGAVTGVDLALLLGQWTG